MEHTTTMAGGTPPIAPLGQSDNGNASHLAVEAKGNRGGKPRKDGLVPGSPEALEADRKKDAERKRRARSGGVQEPAPLPSLADGKAMDAPPPSPASPAVVPWSADTLAPLFKELVPLIEDTAVNSLAEKAGAAGLDKAQVRKDARWNETAKAGILSAGPAVAAKYLSKTGIPADAAPEVVLGTAILAIVVSHNVLASKLEEMAKQRQDKPQPQNADNPK